MREAMMRELRREIAARRANAAAPAFRPAVFEAVSAIKREIRAALRLRTYRDPAPYEAG